jgi:hypothetical protein
MPKPGSIFLPGITSGLRRSNRLPAIDRITISAATKMPDSAAQIAKRFRTKIGFVQLNSARVDSEC